MDLARHLIILNHRLVDLSEFEIIGRRRDALRCSQRALIEKLDVLWLSTPLHRLFIAL
jgi:hypothetical protein